MTPNSDPMTHYSHTRRIILFIDLNPLLHNHHHQHYTKRILSSIKTLLSFHPLSSSSLFAFKLFFSSLSPLLSSSKLHPFVKPSLFFDHPSSTFKFLSQTLSSLPQFPQSNENPKASYIAASITQLLHDYFWEPDNDTNGTVPIPNSLVLLFTPLFYSFHPLASFFDVVVADDEFLQIESSFCDKFFGFFGGVSRAFRSKGVHCSWIGVNCNCLSESEVGNEIGKVRGLFEIGAEKLGWGFCSLDSIVLGSALVPFGLIYPKIGVSWYFIKFSDDKQVKVQLSLRILDVKGNPIEYSCCDLELVDMRILGRSDEVNLKGGCERKKRFWDLCSDGGVKLRVKVVRRSDAFVNVKDCLYDSVLVRGVIGDSKKKEKGDSDEFFADRVLELLAIEFDCQSWRRSVPVWEMLLSFLYKEGFWALVSIENGNGCSCVCILRPFTVSSALLSILGDSQLVSGVGEANLDLDNYVKTGEAEICESDRKVDKNKDLLDSQIKSGVGIKGKQKKKMMNLDVLQSLTWSSFCELASDHQFEMDLHEIYYAIESYKSKKLKFLKCWMKQVKKSGYCDQTLSGKSKPSQPIAEEIGDKLTELPQNGEQIISPLASAEVHTEASTMQDDALLDFRSETPEAFFSNFSNRIKQGIESEVIDLGALAQRLVNSSINCLCQKVDKEKFCESHSPLKDNNACDVSELMKLLLRKPKEIASKHKGRKSSSHASNEGPTTIVTEHAVREYELQILFRMEILQSEVGRGIQDAIKQKFVKEICLLLENIQCHMGAGFFGDWNLENYVAKIIKSRYSLSLEDVVQKIYKKIDLLQLSDEDETPVYLPNSEDSSKSLNLKVHGDEVGENDVSSEPFSAESDSLHLQNVDHCKRLIEAKRKRERAQRLSSFTSWRPDLQRAWTPKLNHMKPNIDHLQKIPKRKERQRESDDTVCETPMTRNKRSSPGFDDNSHLADGSRRCSTVSKSLF